MLYGSFVKEKTKTEPLGWPLHYPVAVVRKTPVSLKVKVASAPRS